jgi:hypothetical protein
MTKDTNHTNIGQVVAVGSDCNLLDVLKDNREVK